MKQLKTWIYNENLPSRGALTLEFEHGVNAFIEWVTKQYDFMDDSRIRCPCSQYKNNCFLEADEVKVHLLEKDLCRITSIGPIMDNISTLMKS